VKGKEAQENGDLGGMATFPQGAKQKKNFNWRGHLAQTQPEGQKKAGPETLVTG